MPVTQTAAQSNCLPAGFAGCREATLLWKECFLLEIVLKVEPFYLKIKRFDFYYKRLKERQGSDRMRLIVDGDGSPVKREVIQLGKKFNLPVLIVTSIDHYTSELSPDFVRYIYVDKGADRADYEIVKLVDSTDIVITQDYGLASLLLPKGVRVFHHSGQEYKKETIDALLTQRYMSAQVRNAGKRTKGPKAFTQKDREIFLNKLTEILTAYF